LTGDEQAIVQRYPRLGFDLLAGTPYLSAAAGVVLAARERPDGLGYPAGLAGDAIPRGAQIIAAADAYDAMIHPRVFRDALTASEALLEMRRCAGLQFAADVVGVLERLAGGH
jgi:HD-GYP domain-containing protein (c-di-GMP phosphodiesterase class II)